MLRTQFESSHGWKFYFILHTDLLLQLWQHSLWTSGFSLFLSFQYSLLSKQMDPSILSSSLCKVTKWSYLSSCYLCPFSLLESSRQYETVDLHLKWRKKGKFGALIDRLRRGHQNTKVAISLVHPQLLSKASEVLKTLKGGWIAKLNPEMFHPTAFGLNQFEVLVWIHSSEEANGSFCRIHF